MWMQTAWSTAKKRSTDEAKSFKSVTCPTSGMCTFKHHTGCGDGSGSIAKLPDGTLLFSASGQCFHIKIQWLFAQGPMVNERVIKRLVRRVKEYSGDVFRCLTISDIIRNLELNPYIPTTVMREPRIQFGLRKSSEQFRSPIKVADESPII